MSLIARENVETVVTKAGLLTDAKRLFISIEMHVGENDKDSAAEVIDVLEVATGWLIEGQCSPCDIARSIRARLAVLAGESHG